MDLGAQLLQSILNCEHPQIAETQENVHFSWIASGLGSELQKIPAASTLLRPWFCEWSWQLADYLPEPCVPTYQSSC